MFGNIDLSQHWSGNGLLSGDLSSLRPSDNNFRTISQEIPVPSVIKISLEINYLKFLSNLSVVNELRTDTMTTTKQSTTKPCAFFMRCYVNLFTHVTLTNPWIQACITDTCTMVPFLQMLILISEDEIPQPQIDLTLLQLRLEYPGRTRSWLQMTWLLVSPGHQQPWHRPHRINRSLSSMRKDLNNLCHLRVEKL